MNGKTTVTMLGRSVSSDSSDNRAGNNKRWLAKYSLLKNPSKVYRQRSKQRTLCDVLSIEDNGSETIAMTVMNKTDAHSESINSPPFVYKNDLNGHSEYNEV